MSTVVTAYYELDSKHPREAYRAWIENFLPKLDNNLVIYCESSMVEFMQEKRSKFPDKTKIIILPWEEFHTAKYWQQWNSTWCLDPEQAIHSPKLYMIWAEKSAFVRRAIQANYFQTEFFVWMDIGAFRGRDFDFDLSARPVWPRPQRVAELAKDRVFYARIDWFPKELRADGLSLQPLGPSRNVGGLFAGYAKPLLAWIDLFYNFLERYFQDNRFAGKDQNIMANIAIAHPELVQLIQWDHGDLYFALHFYLA